MHGLISGFGAFEGVELNPSGELVRSLLERPPSGWTLEGDVIPVSFARAPSAWDALLDGAAAPDVLVAFGVSGKAEGFDLESLARARPTPDRARPDNDGDLVGAVAPSDESDLETTLDVDGLVERLAGAVAVARSRDAGAYVCERTFHHVLVRGRERGVPGLFVHVPTLERVPFDGQRAFAEELFAALAAQLGR